MRDFYEVVRTEKTRNEVNGNTEKNCVTAGENCCAIINIDYRKASNEAGTGQQEGTTKILVKIEDDIKNCDCVTLTNCIGEDLGEFTVISRDKVYKTCIPAMDHRVVILKKCKNDRV